MTATKTGKWIVRCKCEVIKEVYVSNCTEEEAHTDPFKYSTDEAEVDLLDWEVKSVEPND